MSEEKKKRNKIIGLSIGICAAILLIVTGTYAYWTITKSQNDPNSIIAACLDITMEEQTGTLTPSKNYPISDADGLADSGFTFTIKNHCPQDIAYVIGLDSVEVDTTGTNGYMLDGSIKVSIDNTTPRIFGDLPEIDHIESNDTYTIRKSRKINTAVVPGMKDGVEGTNTHTIKAWIDADAPVTENNKVFGGRVFITGGQYITDDNPIAKPTDESCFTMNGEEIIGYDESCGTSVTIPMYVGENAVTTIDSNAFKSESLTSTYYDMSNNVISSIDKSSAIVAVVLQNHEKGTAPDLANLLTNFDYAISYSDDADTNSTIQGMVGERPLYYQNSTTQDFPGFKNKDLVIYMSDLAGSMLGMEYIELSYSLNIKELDLSQAYNLELIEVGAFSNIELIEDDSTFKNCNELLGDLSNVPEGLTKLVMGKQDEIKIGDAAFAGLKTSELTLYTNIKGTNYNCVGSDFVDEVTNATNVARIFGNSTIETLNINKLNNNSSFNTKSYLSTFVDSNINIININDGIEKIGDRSFSNINVTTINLPNSLTTIGFAAFGISPATNIIIPNNVKFVDGNAFALWPNTSTITVKNNSSISENWGENWSGNATVVYEP